MRLRAMTGGVLAVFLLVFSCVSARCEVVCEMGPFHMHAQPESTKADTNQQASMDDMPGMDCDGPSTKFSRNGGIQLSANMNCDHHACEHESVVTQPEHTLKLAAFVAVYVAILHPQKLQLAIGPLAAFETPPLRGLTPLELNSILRV